MNVCTSIVRCWPFCRLLKTRAETNAGWVDILSNVPNVNTMG